MGHNIQTEYQEGISHWIQQIPEAPYTRKMIEADLKNPGEMAEALLAEFHLTDEETKVKYRPILEQWLSEMPKELPASLQNSRVRDFIYEMF